MIPQVVVAAALVFWAPAHGGRPACDPMATRPQVVLDAPAAMLNRPAWAIIGGGCDAVYVGPAFDKQPLSVQCAELAHEDGHAVEGLPHSPNPRSIMSGTVLNVPPICLSLDPPRRRSVTLRWFDTEVAPGAPLAVAGGTPS